MENQNKETFADKYPIVPVTLSILFGFFCFYMAFSVYKDFSMFEKGEIQSISAPRIIFAIYDILGVWGIVWLCVCTGFYMFYHSYKLYLQKIKK